MPIDITINDISGQTPFDVYVCNTGQTYCVYSATITSGDLPYTFEVPIPFLNSEGVNLRIIDDNDCQINEILII
jgi:hypothetical protein